MSGAMNCPMRQLTYMFTERAEVNNTPVPHLPHEPVLDHEEPVRYEIGSTRIVGYYTVYQCVHCGALYLS